MNELTDSGSEAKANQPVVSFSTTVLTIFIVLFATAVSAKGYFYFIKTKYNPFITWLENRASQAMSELPIAARANSKLILVMGSSEIENSYDPVEVDSALKAKGIDATSFNFGFRDIGAVFPKEISERVKYELTRANRKADLIVIKATVSRLTEKSEANELHQRYGEVIVPYFYKGSPLMYRDWSTHPDLVLRRFLTAYVFDGMSADWATVDLSRRIVFSEPSDWPFAKSEETPANRSFRSSLRLWDEPSLHKGSAWETGKRGYFHFGLPQTQLIFDSLSQIQSDPVVNDAVRAHQVDCCDAVELHFSEALVREFINAIENYKSVAKKVVILYVPDGPLFNRPLEAEARITSLLEEISRTAKVDVLNYSGAEGLGAEDYMDSLHYNESGQRKFLSQLESDFERLLKN